MLLPSALCGFWRKFHPCLLVRGLAGLRGEDRALPPSAGHKSGRVPAWAPYAGSGKPETGAKAAESARGSVIFLARLPQRRRAGSMAGRVSRIASSIETPRHPPCPTAPRVSSRAVGPGSTSSSAGAQSAGARGLPRRRPALTRGRGHLPSSCASSAKDSSPNSPEAVNGAGALEQQDKVEPDLVLERSARREQPDTARRTRLRCPPQGARLFGRMGGPMRRREQSTDNPP